MARNAVSLGVSVLRVKLMANMRELMGVFAGSLGKTQESYPLAYNTH